MKKPVILLSVLIFSLALAVSSLTWADKEEGSGTKESGSNSTVKYDKDKKHSKDYKSGEAGYAKEGSDAKQTQAKSSDHKKMEESGGADKKMKTTAPKREGS